MSEHQRQNSGPGPRPELRPEPRSELRSELRPEPSSEPRSELRPELGISSRVALLDSVTQQRRLRLRVAAKLMIAAAALAMLYVMFAGVRGRSPLADSLPSLRVSVADMPAGSERRLLWEGRPIVIYRRTAADITALNYPDERRNSAWPAAAQSAQDTQWLVAIALSTDLGCSLEFLPVTDMPFQGRPWHGGYQDSCSRTRYDLAGRVFADQGASRDLQIPAHHVSDGQLILGRSAEPSNR